MCNVADAKIHAGEDAVKGVALRECPLNLTAHGVIALEIVEDLQAALEPFNLIADDLAVDVE